MTSIAATVKPVLKPFPGDPHLKWQWFDGPVYLAGFSDEETARRYGRERGWC